MNAQTICLAQPTYKIWWRVKATANTPASCWYKMMTGNKADHQANADIAKHNFSFPEREYCKVESGERPEESAS
jgi:hypothetical protein